MAACGKPWYHLSRSLEAPAPLRQSWTVTSERILVLPRRQLVLKTRFSSDSEKFTDFSGFSCECGHDGSFVVVLEQKQCLRYITGTSGSPGVCFPVIILFIAFLSRCCISCKENANTSFHRQRSLCYIASSTQFTVCLSRVADDTVSKPLMLYDKQFSSSGVMEPFQKPHTIPAIYIFR